MFGIHIQWPQISCAKNANIINIIFLAWTLFFNAPVAVVSAQDVFICIFWHNLFARWSSRCTVSSLKFREGLSSFPSPPPRLSVSIGLLWRRRESGEAGFDWPDWKTFTFQSLLSSPLTLTPASLANSSTLSSPHTSARFGESWAEFSDIPCQLWNATWP